MGLAWGIQGKEDRPNPSPPRAPVLTPLQLHASDSRHAEGSQKRSMNECMNRDSHQTEHCMAEKLPVVPSAKEKHGAGCPEETKWGELT